MQERAEKSKISYRKKGEKQFRKNSRKKEKERNR